MIIHPNPVNQNTNIMLELGKEKYLDYESISTIEVYDIIGQHVHSVTYNIGKQSIQLNCELLATGAYMVKVINQDSSQFSGKLIKE